MTASSSLLKTRCLLRVLVLGLVILASAVPSCPQSGNEGSLEGTVTDPSGAAIPGAVVTVTHAQKRGHVYRQHERERPVSLCSAASRQL